MSCRLGSHSRVAHTLASLNWQRFYESLRARAPRTARAGVGGLVSALPLRGEWQPRIMFDLLHRPDVHGLVPSGDNGVRDPRLLPTHGDPTPGGPLPDRARHICRWWRHRQRVHTSLGAAGPLAGSAACVRIGSSERVIVGVVNDVRSTALDDVQQPQIYTLLVGPLLLAIVARSPLPSAQALAHPRAQAAVVSIRPRWSTRQRQCKARCRRPPAVSSVRYRSRRCSGSQHCLRRSACTDC